MAADSQWLYSVRSSRLFSIFTVGLGMICDGFLYVFVVPLLPSFLERRAHVPPQDIQKAISTILGVYAFSACVASPFAGLIADRLSRRSLPFLCGLAFLTTGTAMFMSVQTFPLLVFARALQGFSTAIVYTVGLAMLLDRVGAARMGVTIGTIFGIMSGAQLAAPVLGGWLYEKAGMKALTAVAVGIVALDFSMRIAVIETTDTSRAQSNSAGDDDQHAPSVPPDQSERINNEDDEEEVNPLLASNQPGPKTKIFRYPLPKRLPPYASSFPVLIVLYDPRLLAAYVVQFTQSFQFSAIDATLPAELAARLGLSSGPISLMILPWILPFMIFDPIFGRLVDRIGAKIPALVGISSWAVVLLLMRIPLQIIDRGHRNLGMGIWVGLMVLNGMSAAAVGSAGIVTASAVAEGYVKEHPHLMIRKGGKGPYAQLYAIGSIVFHGALAAGAAAAGALRSSVGYSNMNVVLAALQLVTLVVCYIYMDGQPTCGKGYEPQIVTEDHDSSHGEEPR